jgi:hypothetical protein
MRKKAQGIPEGGFPEMIEGYKAALRVIASGSVEENDKA